MRCVWDTQASKKNIPFPLGRERESEGEERERERKRQNNCQQHVTREARRKLKEGEQETRQGSRTRNGQWPKLSHPSVGSVLSLLCFALFGCLSLFSGDTHALLPRWCVCNCRSIVTTQAPKATGGQADTGRQQLTQRKQTKGADMNFLFFFPSLSLSHFHPPKAHTQTDRHTHTLAAENSAGQKGEQGCVWR